MQRLKTLLYSIFRQSSVDDSRRSQPDNSSPTASASIFDLTQLLRRLHEFSRNTHSGNQQADATILALIQLRDHLRILLERYIDPETDCIGYALPNLGPGGKLDSARKGRELLAAYSVSPLDSFLEGLVKGAAAIGVERVVELLSGWLQGQPIEFRIWALVNGLTVDAPLVPAAGVYIDPLPFSTDQLPAHLPKKNEVSEKDYLGRTVVGVDCTAHPALFRPHVDPNEAPVEVSLKGRFDIAAVCHALALISDRHVEPAFYWSDYQELTALGFNNQSWSLGSQHFRQRLDLNWSMSEDLTTGVTTLHPDDQTIARVSEVQLRETLSKLEAMNSQQTHVAVSRWMKSKNDNEHLADRFIDLRIALELLYLKDFVNENSPEMRFRLGLFGAWYLGSSFKERKAIRKALRDVYDKASGAAHLGEVEHSAVNMNLLWDGQGHCRRGILKLLTEGPPQDWGDLILGSQDSC